MERSRDSLERHSQMELISKLTSLLSEPTRPFTQRDWKLEIGEIETDEVSGAQDEDLTFKGKLYGRLRRWSDTLQEFEEIPLFDLTSENSGAKSLKRGYGGDSDYSYQVDIQQLVSQILEVLRRKRYQEAGGNPESPSWTISAQRLREWYPELFLSQKALVDGWAKTMDTVLHSGETKDGLTVDQAKRAEYVCGLIVDEFSLHQKTPVGSRAVIVAAGNSAGVQKRVVQPLETAGIESLLSLPLAKPPEKYVTATQNLIVMSEPQRGQESKWGDELVGETGIASTDFGIQTIFLIGGGEKTTDQLKVYLDNALRAIQKGKRYRLIVVGGVGGFSEKETFLKAVTSFQNDPSYRELFSSGSLGKWLEFVESTDEGKLLHSIMEATMSAYL